MSHDSYIAVTIMDGSLINLFLTSPVPTLIKSHDLNISENGANKLLTCDCSLCRQEALLAAISEKDANIALLELSSSKKKKTQEEVAALKREKDSLVQQLKQQVGLLCSQLTHTPLHPSVHRKTSGHLFTEES